MSDIDDELLALAGSDASDAEDSERGQSRSSTPEPSSSKKQDAPARGTATKKTPAKKSGNRRSSRSYDGSEDEGEASSPPGSPGSQMSAPMDESDSDSDGPLNQPRGGADEEAQYPVEGLFKSFHEKEHIMGMREIEREQILAERREENTRIRQNRMLRQLKVNQEKEGKKRKASAADLDDASRKSSRARTKAGGTSEKMDTLRRAREERTNRREQRERDNDRRKQRSPSYDRRSRSRSIDDRDSDRGGSRDREWRRDSRQKSTTPEPKEILPAELRDVERIRVGRSRFAEVCFYPGVEKALTGCYVRINIGPDPTSRQDVYRMAVIKGFTTGRPYAIPDSSGHQMVVDMYVKAAHGKASREWPFITCSDRPFTEAEWNRYKQVCLSEGLTVPTRNVMVDKITDINRLVRRQWTEQELSEKLKRQNSLMTKFSNTERDELVRKLEAARARGDNEAIQQLQEKLENLEIPKLAFRTSLAPAFKKNDTSKGPTQQEKLALLNLENRKRNAEEVRKAQLRDRARNMKIRPKAKEGEESSQNGAAGADKDNKDPVAANGLLPHIAKLQEAQRSQAKNGVPMISKPLMDDDIIGALDLDIDVEID
ncbi:putative RNA polymerase-associated protein RTF1 [Podospora fimiseda]|uniref:RNA polymerase-associated protein RTF1 n=1 Tax=Podospora fimiseda TaxID=252190 RepID=A0AAN7BTZ9_9PEZI|nr:putative RNA polymerase-associated protein RTF1 [Podospora fimiseda]